MPQTRLSRPGRPLDDDWLFADPMAIDLEDVDEPEPVPASSVSRGALVCLRRMPRRRLSLACALLLAASATAAVVATAAREARLMVSAVSCTLGTASRADTPALLPGKG